MRAIAKKYVWLFVQGNPEGDGSMKNLLGGKGANLHEMCRLGLPVPPGFTITTEACIEFLKTGKFPKSLTEEIDKAIKEIEKTTGKSLGGKGKPPLLFSIRSGARASMPGMMDTVLNVGLNDDVLDKLIAYSNNKRFALDCYRRFLEMYSDVVCKLKREMFERILEDVKKSKGKTYDIELDEQDLEEIIERYKDLIKKNKVNIPKDPFDQVLESVKAVFNSWNNERAIIYRKMHNIPDEWGTACNIQTMVYGNLNEESGTGVCFTRNPVTGHKELYGEFLPCAQGEDVVAGIRTPLPIKEMASLWPEIYNELVSYCDLLERHYKDMQDVEFTIENKKLYILQTRNGKRTVKAATKIAHDMVEEGIINIGTAILRVDPLLINQLFIPVINEEDKKKHSPIAIGIPASSGAAKGKAVFSSKKAIELSLKGEKVVLFRPETSPEDIGGISKSEGIVTSTGGVTSHAAVVARGMGKPCIVGCKDIVFTGENPSTIKIVSGNTSIELKELEEVTIDANDGSIYLGSLRLEEAKPDESFYKILLWANNIKKLKVFANADTPNDALKALEFGAEGIGLCRTEHMFFEGNRVDVVRLAILAESDVERRKALEELLPLQEKDFSKIFEIMNGLPVTIRLLDPPLHEFLPKTDEETEGFALRTGISVDKVLRATKRFQEVNPMLGLRGVRLGIIFPEIYETQVEAIFKAAKRSIKNGINVHVEIMIPLVSTIGEVVFMKNLVEKVYKKEVERDKVKVNYKFGIMIETPRICLIADKVAEFIDFVSFGTNDLTQTVIGISRDDAAKFLPGYIEKGIFSEDPFVSLDIEGVGKLLAETIKTLKSANPNIKTGICGEQAGDPKTIEFLAQAGVDYVSVSPYRIATAIIATAQASLKV